MQYKVAEAKSAFTEKKQLDNLQTMVNELISLGWRPLGGITVTQGGRFIQTMVKD